MASSQQPQRGPVRHKRQNLFINDLRNLLYASGDSTPQPLDETLRVLEEITVTYVTETCLAAATLASAANRTKIKIDDFKFALRRDNKKLGRVQELLVMKKVIDEAKKIGGLEGGPEDAAATAAAAGGEGGGGGALAKGEKGVKRRAVDEDDGDESLDSNDEDETGSKAPSKKKKKGSGKAKSVKSTASRKSGASR